MRNILTVDVEEWYHGNDFDLPKERWSSLESRVVMQTDFLLDLLEQANATATFFILGCVARSHPDLVKRIHDKGHEVASHSYYHDLIYGLTPEQFETQLSDSAEVLAEITGEPISAFRAPSWSITDQNMWALDVIRKCGLTVDSSLFPLRTWMYGVRGARLNIHTIGSNGGLLEYPPAAARFAGVTFPVSGGIFFRLLPYRFCAAVMRRMNRQGHPAVVYLHPWELDPDHPRVPEIPRRRTWYHYWGLGSARRKYGRLLRDFSFCSIREHRRSTEAR